MPAANPVRDGANSTLVRWSGLTHVGRFRKNNEDAFLALTFDGHELRYLGKTGEATFAHGDFLFAVSDGLGGGNSGEFASRIAVDRIGHLMPRTFRLSAAGIASGFEDVLTELVLQVHEELQKLSNAYEECAGMGATLTLGWFTPGWMYFAHVGDSRIYYLPRDESLVQLTHDHTHVGWLHRSGKITEREARSHPRRTALQQALGAGHQFVEPHLGAVAYHPGDRFLICSDGLTDGLWNARIEELLRTPPIAGGRASHAQQLVEQAVENSGRDNTTAIVIELDTPPAPAAS